MIIQELKLEKTEHVLNKRYNYLILLNQSVFLCNLFHKITKTFQLQSS